MHGLCVRRYSAFALNYDISLNAEHGFCLLSILITGFIYGTNANARIENVGKYQSCMVSKRPVRREQVPLLV